MSLQRLSLWGLPPISCEGVERCLQVIHAIHSNLLGRFQQQFLGDLLVDEKADLLENTVSRLKAKRAI